ncbi:MAG: SDR family NAD(P)-dependent oxidoreductase, partial [Thermomicrobiales bacterium]|nr:SDR family NAD(P)-dependent oxidoreductase [Thermomicrobiales bacterium]
MRTYLDLDLSGKTAVVTGASSGIGRAIAEALAEAGANVLLVGRNAARLTETVEAVEARGVTAATVEAELTDADAPQRIVEAAVQRFGGVNILVNCAGIFEPMPFDTQPLASFDRQM